MKSVRQLGCVFQDTEPPKSAAISRKGPKVLGPIPRVRFTRAALRQANIRENKGPSLGKSQAKVPHQRIPFKDRSQEEIEGQERCARGDTWRLAKNILQLQETDKATFFSATNEWCLPVPSVIKQEEREFLVDSGTSMHMLSRKDLNSAELKTVKVSESPTTVVAANGEVQTKEEATVYVKELDLFVSAKLLEDSLAVLFLGELCEAHGYSYDWTSGQKPQLTKDDRRLKCSTENYVPIAVPGLSTSSSSSATPTSPTCLSKEAVIPTLHPASTRSESSCSTVWVSPSHEQEEMEKTIKIETTRPLHGLPE